MNWRHPALAACAFASIASAAHAQRPAAITSAYTNLDIDRCRELRRVEEGGSVEWSCPGYGGIPLWVAVGDERYDIDARRSNGAFESTSPFNEPGDRVEWRLRGGRPFAIIYRLRLFGDEARPRSQLAVKSVGQGRRQGCLVAWVDAAAPNANALAREQADRHAATFRCGRDTPRRIGRTD
jgi:hypothetical protein